MQYYPGLPSLQPAALLMHEVPPVWMRNAKHSNIIIMSELEDNLFPDESLLWDCDGCAPPTFNLPPPPRPPWLEDLDGCGGQQQEMMDQEMTLSEWLAKMEACDSTVIRDQQSYFEDTFHSIAIIVVCSILLVIMMLGIGVFLFKRRKSFQPFGGGDHCQGGHPRELSEAGRPPKHHFVGNVNPAIDCATPTHLSHTLGPVKPRQVIHQGHAVTSLMNNGHTTTRCLANHYIPDHHKMMTLDNHVVMQRKQVIADEFRQRFGPVPERRNVMELSERPPVPVPTAVYQMADYPHIVIGGKPFYLIPSSDTILQVEAGGSESYAYPQHMPIYEEIDYNTVMGAAPTMLSSSGSSARPGVMDRPLSSAASHSNSAHTNTSELSSVGSNSSSSQKMDDHNLSGGHLVVNPQHCTPTHRSLRLADGLERSRSPQSIYSARLVNQQQQQQNNKPSSVYYYSDTLKTKNSRNYANDDITALDDSCCDEDTKVNTRVILEDATAVKNGSTLV